MVANIRFGQAQTTTRREEQMKIRVRSAVACLVLISFASCHAVACVTAETDLSGGGWETSAAADPCSSVQSGRGVPLSSGPTRTKIVAAHKYSSTWVGCVSYYCGDILTTLVLLLAPNRVEITSTHQDAPGVVLNISVTGANI